MNKLELGIVGIALLIVTFLMGGLWGHHLKTEADNLSVAKQEQEQQDKIQQLTEANKTLAASAASLVATVQAKDKQITTQPPQVRYVYIKTKSTPQNPQPAPTLITGDVYITWGSVWLYNSSFGLSSLSSEPTAESAKLPSSTTISDYQITTANNAVACYQNQQSLIQDNATLLELQKLGIIKIK